MDQGLGETIITLLGCAAAALAVALVVVLIVVPFILLGS